MLDALDECEERSRDELLDMFSNYFLPSRDNRSNFISGGSSLQELMTSRPYDQIYTKLFRLLRFESTIRLKTEDHGREIDADIQSFISQSE